MDFDYRWEELFTHERELIGAIESGQYYWPTTPGKKRAVKVEQSKAAKPRRNSVDSDTRPVIRAAFLRDILLGAKIERVREKSASDWMPIAFTPAGLRISPPDADSKTPTLRVRIAGTLDLRGLCGPGGTALAALAFEYCDFDDDIEMAAIHVASLSFKGSHFSRLFLNDAEVKGPVDLSWCEPSDGPPNDERGERTKTYRNADLDQYWPFADSSMIAQADTPGAWRAQMVATPDPDIALPQCVVHLANASIDGNVSCTGARFVRPNRQADGRIVAACNLRGAIISGSVHFVASVVIGTIEIRDAHISENIGILSSRILAYSGDSSIELQCTQCDGMICFSGASPDMVDRIPLLVHRQGFDQNVILGWINAIGAKARYFWISTGVLLGYLPGQYDWGVGIDLSHADIANSIWLGSYNGQKAPAAAFAMLGSMRLTGTRVGGSLMVTYFGAKALGGMAACDAAPTAAPFLAHKLGYAVANDRSLVRDYCTLEMQSLFVGDVVSVKSSSLCAIEQQDREASTAIDGWRMDACRGFTIGDDVTVVGAIRLNRSKIGRLLSIAAGRIDACRSNRAIPTAIDARGIIVDGDIILGGTNGSSVVGAARFSGAQISGDVHLQYADFSVRADTLLKNISGTASSQRHDLLAFDGVKIGGRFRIQQVQLSAAIMADDQNNESHERQWNLPFLRDYALVEREQEIQLSALDSSLIGKDDGNRSVAVRELFLMDRKGGGRHPLDGNNQPVHMARTDPGRLDLATEQLKKQYVAFFCDSMQGDDGSFRIVDSIDKSAWRDERAKAKPAGETDDPVDAVNAELVKLGAGSWQESRRDDGRTKILTTVLYGDMLSNVEFALSGAGDVEMVDDQAIGQLVNKPLPNKGVLRPVVPPSGVTFVNYFGSALATTDAPVSPPPAQNNLHIDLNLEQLHCGLFDDSFGDQWQLDGVQLRSAGMECRAVEPAGDAIVDVEKSASTDGEHRSQATENDQRSSGETPLTLTRRFESRKSKVQSGASRKRLDWLAMQFPAAPNPSWLLSCFVWALPARWLGRETIADSFFVPQAWDMFANAHIRAGEAQTGRDLLVERKDIESLLLAKRARWWRISPENWDNARNRIKNNESARKEAMWRKLAFLAVWMTIIVGLVAALWAFSGQPVSPGVANNILPLIYGAGMVAAIIMILPAIVIIGALLFRFGFKYGLSAPRAIVTFLICIGVGAAGTHWARTGSYPSLTTNWDALRAADGTPKPQIALVLATNYGANAPTPAPHGPGPIAGEVVYGRAAFCNLGVSSWQYAMDVFIPVLDLDQESRCSIREENEAVGSYNLWRWAKILYEMLGWVVTSLTILTITGVMRRDMERN